MEERTADIVVFSDGSHPDPRDDQSCQDLPRAGWVPCIKGKSPMEDQVLYSSWVVTPSMVARWSERETQIVMVTMIGCLLAIDYLAPRFLDCITLSLSTASKSKEHSSKDRAVIPTSRQELASFGTCASDTTSRPISPTSAVSRNPAMRPAGQTSCSCRKLEQSGSI